MKSNLSEITRRADSLYGAREQIENVRVSVELLDTVAGTEDFEAAWRLGRALFFLGQEEQSRAQARVFYARGIKACECATRAQAARVEGHFWLGVNLALQAEISNAPMALVLALRAKRALERAASLNPSYHDAGPLRVLARLRHKLPRLLGGGRRRAHTDFLRAIELAPANTVTRLYFAELLLEDGDKERARRELETILSAPVDAAWAFETARDRLRARELLQRFTR